MLRSAWIVCVIIFSGFALACSGGGKRTAPMTRTGGPPDTPADQVAEAGSDRPVIGGLRVDVLSWDIDEVPLLNAMLEGSRSRDALFIIRLELAGVDPGKKFDYESWSQNNKVELTDDLGNRYQQVRWTGPDTHPIGQIVRAQVYSDKVARDVLVFERPVPAAKKLTLKLPHPDDDSRFFQFWMPRLPPKRQQ